MDAIAQKYIRPDEGTYEFALMYLPAEAVYYELVCGRLGAEPSPLGYALERRVIPVSPSTLNAYLLVLVLGFKGMQIEEHAREVMAYVRAARPRLRRASARTSRSSGSTSATRSTRSTRDAEQATRASSRSGSNGRPSPSSARASRTSPELPRALDAA